jgi:glycogen(starch) synthase
MRIAFVSRELHPLGGGGIGQFVASAARLLSSIAEVTIVTTSVFEPEYEKLRKARDPRLPDTRVRIAFVPEPTVEEVEPWYHIMHCYGARVHERLKELYPDGGPDLIEFPDFLGEAFVPLQAAQALDPFLANTRLCVRIHTTAEICEVLDGYYKRDPASQALHAMERYALAHADRLIWQGGDILGSYGRFYGRQALAPDQRIRYPYRGPGADPRDDGGFIAGMPTRVLYLGRIERRKGIKNLVRAATAMARDDFRLTLIGADTDTAPLGVSMRDQLRLEIADDPRIALREPLDRSAVAELIRAHDVVAIPSLWECWPYAALEALSLNRPVLATPVGGLVELVRSGQSGWLASATDAAALEEGLEGVLDAREELEQIVRDGRPAAVAKALSDEQQILDSYQTLLHEPTERRTPGQRRDGRLPLVSAIIPYYRGSRYVREAVQSLLAQSYPRLEIVLVNDGSFDDQDWIVGELAGALPVVVVSQVNQGLGAARNFGVLQSRGRYVFPLDCDNAADPEFVARCVEVLELRPEIAYVTSWSRYVEDDGTERPGPQLGYQPLGNEAALVEHENVAGDAAAVIRRRLFDAGFRYSEELTSFEDWHLYRELARAGHYGVVIPERLLRYRVRSDSMQAQIAQPRRARLEGEIDALMRESAIRWTAPTA